MSTINRILLIVPAQLGDVLLCTPMIAAARARWPSARIDVLGFAGTLALLEGHPDVGQRLEIRRSGGRVAQLLQALALRRRYDLALVARSSDRAHLYGAIAAPLRSAVVPERRLASIWKHWLAAHAVDEHAKTHQVLQKLQLLEPWVPVAGRVSLRAPQALPLPTDLTVALRTPAVVVHVPSQWAYKRWPAAHFNHVVDGLVARGIQVILTGAATQEDRLQVQQVSAARRWPDVIDACGRLTFPQLHTLFKRVQAYCGPDTSVTHLAAAVGVPIVTVFGPTDPQDFGPWPAAHAAAQPWQQRAGRQQVGTIVVLQGPDRPGATCVPCNRMGCQHQRDSSSHCLDNLPPQRVLDELIRMVKAQVEQTLVAGDRACQRE